MRTERNEETMDKIVERPSWDDSFMEVAYVASKRATCLRRKVGAVIVKNNQILSTGYNGAPSGVAHCTSKGLCLRDELKVPSGERHELCYGAHAEVNAISQAAKKGIAVEGGTLYCTTYPCSMCMKSIIGAGIKEIVYSEGYNDKLTETLYTEAGLEVRYYSGNVGRRERV